MSLSSSPDGEVSFFLDFFYFRSLQDIECISYLLSFFNFLLYNRLHLFRHVQKKKTGFLTVWDEEEWVCSGQSTYKYVFSPLEFQFRAPRTNSTIFPDGYYGAVMAGVDVDDGDDGEALAQRLHCSRQSKSHLFAASCAFFPLPVLLQHVCTELTLWRIDQHTSC